MKNKVSNSQKPRSLQALPKRLNNDKTSAFPLPPPVNQARATRPRVAVPKRARRPRKKRTAAPERRAGAPGRRPVTTGPRGRPRECGGARLAATSQRRTGGLSRAQGPTPEGGRSEQGAKQGAARGRPTRACEQPPAPQARAEGPQCGACSSSPGTRRDSGANGRPPPGSSREGCGVGHRASSGGITRLTCSSRDCRYRSLGRKHGASAFSRSSRGSDRGGLGRERTRPWRRETGGARAVAETGEEGRAEPRGRERRAAGRGPRRGRSGKAHAAESRHRRRECACAGGAPPSTWDCTLSTVRWEW